MLSSTRLLPLGCRLLKLGLTFMSLAVVLADALPLCSLADCLRIISDASQVPQEGIVLARRLADAVLHRPLRHLCGFRSMILDGLSWLFILRGVEVQGGSMLLAIQPPHAMHLRHLPLGIAATCALAWFAIAAY